MSDDIVAKAVARQRLELLQQIERLRAERNEAVARITDITLDDLIKTHRRGVEYGRGTAAPGRELWRGKTKGTDAGPDRSYIAPPVLDAPPGTEVVVYAATDTEPEESDDD